jgi:ParB/RepB/Spo0J family partition protein
VTTTLAPPTGLAQIDLDKIDIDAEFNPRTTSDPDALAEITASVKQIGVIQPIVVTTTAEQDRYSLVAGHRRLQAARAAGLSTIPATIHDAGAKNSPPPLQVAIVENLQREDINPVDEAAAYERALKQLGVTQKQLATMISKSPAHVSDRLRLRKLPPLAQQHISAGTLPLTCAKQLAQIAKVAPGVADGCARLIADGEATADDLLEDPAYVVGMLCDVDWDDAPFLQAARRWNSGPIRFAGHIPTDDIDAVNARATALGVTRFSFDQDDLDAAKAYGCLLQFETQYGAGAAFITDAQFALSRINAILDRTEAERAAHNASQSPQSASDESPGGRTDAAPDRTDEAKLERAAHAARVEERRRLQQQRNDAITANRQLGINLTTKLGSRKFDRTAAQLIALLVLARNPDLAPRGIRLTHADYHTVETVNQKNGNKRTRFTPIEAHEARAKLEEWVLRPKQPEEILGRLLQALTAATFADQDALAKSQRTYWSLPAHGDTLPLITKIAAKLLPEHFAPTDTTPTKRTADAKENA